MLKLKKFSTRYVVFVRFTLFRKFLVMSENLPYYYKIRGRVIGPKELSEMRQIAQRAQINSRSLISRDGIDFKSGSKFPEVFS